MIVYHAGDIDPREGRKGVLNSEDEGDMDNSPHPADLIITHGVVITVDGQRRIYADGALAVAGRRIVAVGRSADVEKAYRARQTIDARGGVVLPGMIDCHVHLSQHLGRSTIPDSWPDEREHEQWRPYWTNIREDEARCSAMLACMEMVRNGTTTFCDYGDRFGAEQNAAVAQEAGLRALVSERCRDVPQYADIPTGNTEDCLRQLQRQVEALPKTAERRVWACVGISGMGSCTDGLLVGAKQIADRSGVIMTMHQSFGPGDTAGYRRQTGGTICRTAFRRPRHTGHESAPGAHDPRRG